MNRRKMMAMGVILIVALGVGATTLLLINQPQENADQLQWGDFLIRAKASFWQDFMPIVPEEGPPFFAVIGLNVTNTGYNTLEFHNFSAIRTTVYYNDTSEVLVTLSIFLSFSQELPCSLEPEESIILVYSDRSGEFFSPDIEEGTYFYAKVSFTWDGMNWYTLKTAPSEVEFTY